MKFRGWERRPLTLPDGRQVEAVCPVIVSASRATDIPAFFADWFCNRLAAGYLRRTNPFNSRQVEYVSFQDTRVIVFWSKNPKPMLARLPELDARGLHYYFQFTLNDYEREGLEPHVPPLAQRIETFRALADRIGCKRVIWRFDPLLLAESLSLDQLLERIDGIAGKLRGFTEKLVISFIDIARYRHVARNLARTGLRVREFAPDERIEAARRLQILNRGWGLEIATCAETDDLDAYGIAHNRCIDGRLLLEEFSGDRALLRFLGVGPELFPATVPASWKDKGQRPGCGCLVSKDIGWYGACRHQCAYCYANRLAPGHDMMEPG